MNRFNFFLTVCLFVFASCKTAQLPDAQSRQLLLEAQIGRLVSCLNSGDEVCLNALYADDFSSISPIMQITSKADLISRTVDSFRKNRFEADMLIEELYAGSQLAYVALEYRLYQSDQAGKPTLYLQKKRVDIWEWHPKNGWQLRRSLFYDPEQF